MGTPEFAVPPLEALLESDIHEVVGIFTQPDRPKGRGQQLAQSPVKEIALKHSIPVYQPAKLRNESEIILQLEQLKLDIIVVVAYGQILPKEILSLPIHGCVNIHSSLLPKFRGAAPIHWAIYQGQKETGVSTMLLDEGMDTGPILLQKEIPLFDDTTMGEAHDLLKIEGAKLLLETLSQMSSRDLVSREQDPKKATHAPLITKEHEQVNWNRSAQDIHNQIRAFNPWPGSYSAFRNQRVKFWRSRTCLNSKFTGEIGELFVDQHQIFVQTGDGILELLEVQPQSRSKMVASDWGRGLKITSGEVFKS